MFLTQGMLMVIYLWGFSEVSQRIRTGDIATDLTRPLDVQGWYLAQDLGRAAYHVPAPPIDVPGATVVRVQGPRQWLRFRRDETTAADLVAAVACRARLVDLAVEEPDIEDIVRRIYTGG